MGQHYGSMHDMIGWGTWMVPWGWIFVIILVAIVIYAITGRGGLKSSRPSKGSHIGAGQNLETPLDILKKRYAGGEISREEFEQIKKDISQ